MKQKKKDTLLISAIIVMALNIVLVMANWDILPVNMPAHFNPQGHASGTMPRSMLWAYVGISALICIVSGCISFKDQRRRKALSLITLFLTLIILCSTCVSLTGGRHPIFMFAEPVFLLGIVITLIVTGIKVRKAVCLILLLAPSALYAQKTVIIYENDAHCALSGYASLMTLKNRTLQETKDVLTVSGGDFSADFMSRGTLGTKSQGAGIIRIMNEIGYDCIVPGNHDFDFGIPVMQDNFKALTAATLCCNLKDLKSGSMLYPGYALRKVGDKVIGFVGVATPKTISRQNQSLFCDSEGNLQYSFCEENLASLVQQNIDRAKADGADYVIVLSHLGDRQNGSLTSVALIQQTTGIDVVLDAHAHSTIPQQSVSDKDGRQVILTSTGLKFANIGLLTIENGTISAVLVPTASIGPDPSMQEFTDRLKAEYGVE